MDRYDFLKRAREKHGYKYIYPTLSYKILSNDDIDILYNNVLYKQKVVKHLMGRCPEKNTDRKSTEEFIKEAREVWGDKYDYSLVDYKGALKKVKIIYDNIIFEQVAISHLKGMSVEKNMNQEYFIKKSIEKYGTKYDYSLVEYRDVKTKVKIIYNNTVYEQTPSSHLIHCPEKKTNIKTNSEFIEEANKIHKDKYDYSLVEYKNNKTKIIIKCPIHGEFEQVPNSHLQGCGCKKCGDIYRDRIYKPKYTTSEFIEEAKSIWGDKYDYSLVNYVNNRIKVKIIYDGIIYEQRPSLHLKHPPEYFLNQEIFLIKAKRKWGDKYDYSLVDFKTTKEYIKVIYENRIYDQLPSNHLKYAPELVNSKTLDEFIKESNEIHNNKYSYDKSVYVNDRTLLTITCPIHGDFKQKPHIHTRGCGCKKCSDSFGEKRISKFLDDYNINYYKEHKFEDCVNIYPLRFDFYIPFMRTCIEFDGIQHFEPIEFFGGEESFKRLKQNDSIKTQYCEENYIDLIRIKYTQVDDIENILSKNLKHHIKRLSNLNI